ncbi:hypothetical protein GCM10010172_18670 [Paractinoplanes ferrugineus]|uniref:PepSY domain-containing protein n=1 Tax=Paractinoplanes ferrugineus TaxID=113564 RepID=A0A919J7Q2_9ACTN|nr:PepSY domain-containing protein [Actinoplanes ferrugineus]GIE14842.1 hypothetical protein Afe05nite_66820 [Actinoplanes ferrugineus]
MNKPRKRIVIPAVALVAALGAGSLVWATAAGADVRGGERDRVADAALRAVPGTVLDVETDDDGGAYEVEVRKPDGTETEVVLDSDLKVIAEAPGPADRVLTDADRTAAGQAALTAVPGGTVVEVDAGDDGAAYEVEVRAADNTRWDVDLDAAFKVLGKTAD